MAKPGGVDLLIKKYYCYGKKLKSYRIPLKSDRAALQPHNPTLSAAYELYHVVAVYFILRTIY